MTLCLGALQAQVRERTKQLEALVGELNMGQAQADEQKHEVTRLQVPRCYPDDLCEPLCWAVSVWLEESGMAMHAAFRSHSFFAGGAHP